MGHDSPGPAAYRVENDTVREKMEGGGGVLLLGRNFPGKKNINPSANKSKIEGSTDSVDETPGPGSYNLAGSLLKKNGAVIGSGTKKSIFDPRFVDPNNVPGPGAYNRESQFNSPEGSLTLRNSRS
jgi:hypothetical protein